MSFVVSGPISGRWAGDHASWRIVDGSFSYVSQAGETVFRGGGAVPGALANGVVSGTWSGEDDAGTVALPVVGK